MSKRGVSAEEKRTRMLQLFYEKKDFFQLKELEKIAPKEKGIISQSVKDVVQGLVDDGLVDTDKIGTSVYFWAYPSKARKSREKMLSDLKDKLESVKSRLEQATIELEKGKVGKEENDEREATLRHVEELTRAKTDLLQELKKYSDSDPEVMEQMKVGIEKSKEAANRWTDNIFAIKSWCRNKFMVEANVLDKQFGIPPELDYVE